MRRLALILLMTPALAEAKDKFDVGEDAPAFTLRPLNPEAAKAKIVSLEDYVGPERIDKKKLVLVAFTANACETCKRDLAFFKALASEYRAKDFTVLLIGTDKEDEDSKKLAAAAATAGVDFPLLQDRYGIVANRYMVSTLPVAYLVDENQKVLKGNVAYDDTIYPEVMSAIKQVLGVAEAEPLPASLQPFTKPQPKAPVVVAAPASQPQPAAQGPEPTAKAKKKRGLRPKKAVQTAAAPADDTKKGPKRIGRKPAPPP